MIFFSEIDARSFLEASGYLVDGLFFISPPNDLHSPSETEANAIEFLVREYEYCYEDLVVD